ncbi:eukaryotic rRNA processing [Lasiosphaeria ovina]|uniref:Eukaryotic rRNA processing n=1 Tax=Lasiosphaeria ovina TaxID=92902 RepID=A0AAE0KCB6_9PEZI|nr:eukaryotic rRNA processing [Lasiosphaeria ovina]
MIGYDNHGIDLAGIDDSDSDSEFEKEDKDDQDDGNDSEDEIDVDDLSISGSEDEENMRALTRIRETINNKDALLASLKRIALDVTPGVVPFAVHQSVVAPATTESAMGDAAVDDDLARELAFMNQAMGAARTARALLRKEGVPFTRPVDYFAETLRSDATMELVKAKMVEEATAKKASAEARKLRDLKKFGKQIQVAKQQERAKEKREVLSKIDQLKKKRKEGASAALGANEAEDMFDVAVDNELGDSSKGKKRSAGGDSGGRPNKRVKKDTKFGYGGKKRHAKSGDATSSGDLSAFSAKRMKSTGGGRPGGAGGKPGGGGGHKAPRLGKSRRKVAGRK